jgi:hypothetical protein
MKNNFILLLIVAMSIFSCVPQNTDTVLPRGVSAQNSSQKTSVKELNLNINEGELWNIKSSDKLKVYDFNFYIEDPVFLSGEGFFKDQVTAKVIVQNSKLNGSIQATDDKLGFFLGISLIENTKIKQGSKILSAIPGIALYCHVNLNGLSHSILSDAIYFGDSQIAEGKDYDFEKEIEKGCQIKRVR